MPGFLKGLSGQANLTVLDTHGDFGGRTNLTTGQVAGFIPRTGNASLSWRYRGFSTRLLANYTSTYISSYSATSPNQNLYRVRRNLINLGLGYQVRPALSLTLDIENLFNVPQRLYKGIPDQLQSVSYPGTTISIGVTGRF